MILNRDANTIHTANIGDSGFVVVRRGEVVHKSEEQQHYFNTPYQLSVPPEAQSRSVHTDRYFSTHKFSRLTSLEEYNNYIDTAFCSPESADASNFRVEDGDVILLATDGVFDNVPLQMILTELTRLQGERDVIQIQKVANTIAFMARSLAFDSKVLSPFARAARKNGYNVSGNVLYSLFNLCNPNSGPQSP